MTNIEPAANTAVAVPEEYAGPEGLEDFGREDMVMPTLRINHETGAFVDGLSGEEYPNLEVILLGLIKQRVLWDAEVSEGKDTPLCRSYDFNTGHPDMDRFPWVASQFPKPADEVALPCANCTLKDWGSHPNRDTPWCSEQHTFALLMPVTTDGDLAPALLTVQRSGIKPSKTYLTAFSRANEPLFTVRTKISLDHRRRGSVNFAVPKFVRGAATPQEEWAEYSANYKMVRDFVQTPRFTDAETTEVEEYEAPQETPVAAPTTAPAAATATHVAEAAPAPAEPATAPAAAAAPVAETEDDGLPF